MSSYTWIQETPVGNLTCVAGADGLRSVHFSEMPIPDASQNVASDIASELDEYFAGTRQDFDISVDLGDVHAPFHRNVLETLFRGVAFGETVTYGELAEMSGSPRAARAVGEAMRRNPIPIVIPCHRVVAVNGLGGYMGRQGLDTKRWLLAHEGVQSQLVNAA